MLKEGKVQGVEVPNHVFGESFKTFLMKEDMDMIILLKEVSTNCVIYYICKIFISYQGMWNLNRHLQKKLSDARLIERFVFINPTLENRSRSIANHLMHAKRADYIFIPYNLVLVALDMRTMTAYYLDPMQKQPCDDLKEIALRIHPTEKQKSSKREPTCVKVLSIKSCRSHFHDSHMFSSHDK
ncbi:hypothetical protein AAG906_027981 [Vitis piasezkii]